MPRMLLDPARRAAYVLAAALSGLTLACGPTPAAKAPSPSAGAASSRSTGAAAQDDGLRASLALAARVGDASRTAGVVANNGGTLISDRGTGVVSNNGGMAIGARSVLQVAVLVPPTLEAADAAIGTPGAGLAAETPARRVAFAGGDAYTVYVSRDRHRLLQLGATGQPMLDVLREVRGRKANGDVAVEYRTEIARPGSAGGYRIASTRAIGADGTLTRFQVHHGLVVAPERGLAVEIGGFELDLATGRGEFTLAYGGSLGLVETGRLAGFVRAADGSVGWSPWDPLDRFQGESLLRDAAGALVLTRRQVAEGTGFVRRYEFPDGLVVETSWLPGRARNPGFATRKGRRVADIVQRFGTDGALTFDVTPLDKAPAYTVRAGGDEADAGSVPPDPQPAAASGLWRQIRLAGRGTAGLATGTPAGLGLDAAFDGPEGVTWQGEAAIVADARNGLVRKVPTVPAPDGSLAGAPPVTLATLPAPRAVAAGPDGRLYALVAGGNRLVAIAPDGQVLPLAGAETAGEADGPGTVARFRDATALAFDDRGRLWISDSGNRRLRRVSLTNGAATVSTLAVTGLESPQGLAADGAGGMYACDSSAHRVLRIADDGVATPFAGTGAALHLDGPAASAAFERPTALARGDDGALYVADSGSFSVRRIAADGQVTTLAAAGLLLEPELTRAQTDHAFRPAGLAWATALRGLVLTDAGGHGLDALLPPAAPRP